LKGHPGREWRVALPATSGAEIGDVGELIAKVDSETGAVIGSVDKDIAHRDGIWHATIHVWVLDSDGRILLQHRAYDKKHFPGMWDISAAGHIAPGESGAREVQEELGAGVEIDELELVGILSLDYLSVDFINRERPRVYLWRTERTADRFTFRDGEVIGLASLTVEELEALVAGTAAVVPVWRGTETSIETIEPAALVPLGDLYWQALLAKLH